MTARYCHAEEPNIVEADNTSLPDAFRDLATYLEDNLVEYVFAVNVHVDFEGDQRWYYVTAVV